MSPVDPRVVAFRELHEQGCFILPNPWDVGSAKFLAHLGFKALATTSAGFAYSRGLPDNPGALPVEAVVAHCRELTDATPLPVNADFQDGYGDSPEAVAASVTACVRAGVAGLSIEDRGDDLYPRDVALERLRAARAAIDATGVPVVLTARCEAFLMGHPDAARIALDRLVAFADAGADCLYAPRVLDIHLIDEIVRAVAPLPVNVLVSAPTPGFTFERLEELGVRRISVGSALARVAWGSFTRAARALVEGNFESLTNMASFAELDRLFSQS